MMLLFFVCLGETVALLKSEVKSQEKHVEALKKRSLWSRTLEEVNFFSYNLALEFSEVQIPDVKPSVISRDFKSCFFL